MKAEKSIIINEIMLRENPDVVYKDELIFLREEQIKEFYEMLNKGTPIKSPIKDVNYYGDPLKYIWGWKGTGKTTMMKWFEHQVTSMEVKCIYINCNHFPTPAGLINEIQNRLKSLYPNYVSPATGTRPKIVDYVRRMETQQVFLMLDEIDKVLRNSNTEQKDEFLHFIIRLTAENSKAMFKVLWSTNIVNIERKLSDEVTSFLQREKIIFGVYSVPEMVTILDKRAKQALIKESYKKEDLHKIAYEAFNTYDGDIRTALSLLRSLARVSEYKLDMTKFQQIKDEMDFEILKKEVLAFSKGAQILLAALVENIPDDQPELGKAHRSSDEMFEIYSKYCKREGEKVLKRSMYYKNLNALRDALIVVKRSEGYKFEENVQDLKKCIRLVV